MRAVRRRVERLLAPGLHRAPPILIQGETGTGKTFLASLLHRAGPRAQGPFVAVDCAAIPHDLLESELFGHERGAFTDAHTAKAGMFQVASRGTLFLDEIGALSGPLQSKLLTALESRSVRRLGATRAEPVDLWVLAATSVNLAAATRAGRFLEALYHRLAVVTLELPPLRERGDDILALGESLLTRVCADYGLAPRRLSDDARAALRAHAWPGNVRELGNVMERAALLAEDERITAEPLELSPREVGDEAATIREALQATGGNVKQAAARLGLPRSTLRHRLARHGLYS